MQGHPLAFAVGVFGAALFAAAIVASAVVIGRITDDLVVPVLDQGEPVDGRLQAAVALVVGVSLWKAAGIVLRRVGAAYLQARTQADLREAMVRHLLRLELAWFRRQSTGDLLAISDSDASQATYILSPLPYGTGASLLLVGTAAMVFFIDPLLGLLVLGWLVLIVAIDIRGSWRTFAAFQEVQERRGEVSGVAHESVDGALTVKALGREDYEVQRFRRASERLRDRVVQVGRIWTGYRAVVESLPAVATVTLLVLGAVRVRAGVITPGDVVTVAYLLSLLTVPIQLIGFVLWEISSSLAGWERVESVLKVQEEVRYGSEEPRTDRTAASVSGEGVSFAYVDGEVVLEDVSLSIPPGTTVAVVGPTASGKSTLAMLLARLWDPTSGRILLDGRDLRRFQPSALPQEVAFVSQEAFLFDDTVRGNIAFGLPVSQPEVEEAARLAGADEFIAELPHGYDTRIGERGVSLSGGQRQRVALARALVRKPRLLILDDATSAVDPSVEARILEGLKRADLPSTVVVVAYRRSSIALADLVVYVEDGRVVAQGTHDELLFRVPGYARLLQAYDEDAAQRRQEVAG